MIRKIIRISIIILIIIVINKVYAIDITKEIEQEINLNSMLDTLEEYTEKNDINLYDIKEDLVNGNIIDYGVIGGFFKDKISNMKVMLKLPVTLLLIVILLAVINSLELDEKSGITKIVNLIGFLIICSISLEIYKEQINSFIGLTSNITDIMNIIIPFVVGMLIATGEIVTSGVLGPILLTLTSIIGIVITKVVCPMLSLSIIFKLISSISKKVKLNKFASFVNSSALWIVGIIFTVFLAVLELQTTLTTSVDSVTIKTTQAAVSNVVPVVGKFVSDSLEVVMGASQIIGKSMGIIGIIVIIVVTMSPILEIIFWIIAFSILAGFAEMLISKSQLSNLFDSFKTTYKTILGLISGCAVTYIISIGIIIKLIGNI